MRARYYNQDIKRFINRDVVSGEITNSGSLNRYCYVQGNPVSLTDPFGLCPDSNSAFRNLCNNLYHMDWNALGHAALDVAGIFFDGADVINAIWYACEGNMEMAAASAVCAIPALGMATGNLLMKSNKLAAAGKAVKAIAKMTQGVMGVCAGIEMAKTGFTNFLDGLEAGTIDAGALLQTLGGIGIAMLSGKGLASSGRELLACTGNSGKTMKGTLIDADISNVPIESEGMATYAGGNAFKGGSSTWTSDKRIYSVAYEIELPSDMYPNVSDARHFQEANRQLHEAFVKDPAFAQAMETLYPGIIDGVAPGPRGAYPRTAPTPDVTWHHEPNRVGILQLIPSKQHTASGPIQSVLHPNGRGGMENWGGGRRRKK